MDILLNTGTRWRVFRPWRHSYGDPAPWMAELAGGGLRPHELGRRPIVVTRNGVVVHVEPKSGHGTHERFKQIDAAIHKLPPDSDEAAPPREKLVESEDPTARWGIGDSGAGGVASGG